MKFKIIYFLILFIFTSLVSSYYAIKNKKENKILIEKYGLLKEEYEIYQSQILQKYQNNNNDSPDDNTNLKTILNKSITVDDISLINIDNKTIQFSDILDNEKLIFRFNQSKVCSTYYSL